MSDGSEHSLFESFGVEVLVAPLKHPSATSTRIVTSNQKAQIANALFKEVRRALLGIRELVHVISEEVTNRDNRTCLLLPPKTFGDDFARVRELVREAALNRDDEGEFRAKLRRLSSALPRCKGRHYVGSNGLVFFSPGKSGARHGIAPFWSDGAHTSSCVIQGRLRFGVSFDPRFHYDCELYKRKSVTFPGCHESTTVKGSRPHVNVAPNDNIR